MNEKSNVKNSTMIDITEVFGLQNDFNKYNKETKTNNIQFIVDVSELYKAYIEKQINELVQQKEQEIREELENTTIEKVITNEIPKIDIINIAYEINLEKSSYDEVVYRVCVAVKYNGKILKQCANMGINKFRDKYDQILSHLRKALFRLLIENILKDNLNEIAKISAKLFGYEK